MEGTDPRLTESIILTLALDNDRTDKLHRLGKQSSGRDRATKNCVRARVCVCARARRSSSNNDSRYLLKGPAVLLSSPDEYHSNT